MKFTHFALILLFVGNQSFSKTDTDSRQFIKKVHSFTDNFFSCVEIVNKTLPVPDRIYKKARTSSFDNPKKTNWKILESEYNSILNLLQPEFLDLLKNGNLNHCSKTLLEKNETVLTRIFFLRSDIDRLVNQGDLKSLTEYNWIDLRGYLNLKKRMQNDDPELKEDLYALNIGTLNDLIGMCRNNGGPKKEDCKEYLNKSMSSGKTFLDVFRALEPVSTALYDSFFRIEKSARLAGMMTMRTESLFKMFIPFDKTSLSIYRDFFWESLKKFWNTAGLELEPLEVKGRFDARMVINNEGISYVYYHPKHTISMDRQTLDFKSPETQFAMAHEFGHILGFSDCYLEFYDTEEKAVVYYSLDPENIMCSRSGKVLPIHIEELRKVYR